MFTELPDDILKIILTHVVQSAYICLLNTCKVFRLIKRTFKIHEIIEDSFTYPPVGIYLLNLGFHYQIVPKYKLLDLLQDFNLFVTACKTGTKFEYDETLGQAIKYDKFEIADYLTKRSNDYDTFFKYACQYYKFDMIEKNIKYINDIDSIYRFAKRNCCTRILGLLSTHYKDKIYNLVSKDGDLLVRIIVKGNLDLLKWTENIYPNIKNNKSLYNGFVRKNHQELVSYCQNNGYKIS